MLSPKSLAIAAVWLLLSSAPAAMAEPRTLRLRHLTPAEGLAQTSAQAILQDREGFIWIGTQDGLDRYDGLEFRHFRHDKRNPRSLANSFVWSLAEDDEGNLWVGTDDGLSRFDRASGEFFTYRNHPGQPGTLAGNSVRVVARDPTGPFLWVGTNQGLCRLDPATDRTDCGLLAGQEVMGLHLDRDGTVWAGTRGGLHRLPPSDKGAAQFYANQPGDPATLAPGPVRSIFRDRLGRLWVGAGGGLSLYEPAADRFRSFLHDPADGSSLAPPPVRALVEDGEGRLWVGGDRGLSLLNEDGRTFTRFQHVPGDPAGLSNDRIFSLMVDRTGLVWIGTFSGGAQLWNPFTWDFGHINSRAAGARLSNDSVNAVAEDAEGRLWIGTAGGLNHLDRAAGRNEVFLHRPGEPGSLGAEGVMALAFDHHQRLWVGLEKNGLQFFEPRTRRFESVKLPADDPAAGISFLYASRALDLWAGIARGGLIRLGGADPSRPPRHFRNDPGDPSSLPHDHVTCMAEAADGALWVGTDGGGLAYLPAGGESFVTVTNDPADPSSLSSNKVFSLGIDDRGDLWVGHKGAGLDKLEKFDSTTGRASFSNVSDRNGLPSNTIYSVVPDQTGQLWISTTNGLARFEPKSGQLRVFHARHGLQNDEFNFGAARRGRSGELFFGGHNGINAFFPGKVRTNPAMPSLHITGVYGRDRRPLGPPDAAGVIEIPPDESTLSFEFVALDFTSPEDNSYAFRLEGFDDRWTELRPVRPATFTNLAARDYRFQVIGASPDGVWNRQGASLRLRVLPPWWETWWASTLFVLSAFGLLYSGVRWRLAGLRRRSEELQVVVAGKTAELSATVDRLKISEQAALDAKMRAMRALEEALEERRKAQEANRAKSVFLSNISHELRTPLNAVLGFAQLMERDLPQGSEQHGHLGVILRSGEHLLSLINDVLSFAKIEAGRFSLSEQPFELRRVLRDVEDMVRVRADAKGLRLEVELETPLPTVIGDEARLTQVLLNLLGNAVKFTERGTVTLQMAWVEGQARCVVKDTGVGIAPDELGQLFEPFVQAASGRKQLEGTGLGLAISRRLVGLMGGELKVESRLGQGSTFSFTIALPAASAAAVASSKRGRVIGLAPDQPTVRLLIADDAPENRDLLLRLLQPLGVESRAASDGGEAVEIWSTWRPHLILLDIRMPVLDGYGAIRRIRQAEAEAQSRHTVIVALTASAFEHDRRRMLTAGFDDILTKPFRSQALFDLLHQWLDLNFLYQDGSSSGQVPAADRLDRSLAARPPARPLAAAPAAAGSGGGAKAPSPALQKKRVLVAEDDPANQQVAQRALERLGLIVDLASNGKEALDACQRERYDLVLMDVQMPVLDGIEAARAIRRLSGRGGTVPIVALTGLPTPEEKLHCLDAGMDDLLAKPFRLDDLRIMVERWLDRLLKPAPPPVKSREESGAQRAHDDSRELYVLEIRNLFLETAPFQLESLRMAAASFDLDRLAQLAGSLKASSANLGATHLATACDRVMVACHGEERPAGHEREIEEAIAELAEAMQRTIADLRKKRRAKVTVG